MRSVGYNVAKDINVSERENNDRSMTISNRRLGSARMRHSMVSMIAVVCVETFVR